ncbi:MAG: dienelactone hydrolase family protein [Gemmatimonadales bacterium]
MQRSRGFTFTPILTTIAFVAAIAGGVRFGQRHPYLAVTTHGEWVKFANASGDSIRAYVAYPERQGKAPAVIVIHEIFGLTDWEPTMGDHFAAQGYVAIVPDLLSSRYHSSDAVKDSATRLVSALPDAALVADLNASYKYVNSLPATQKDNTGVIGFCWGGGTVWKYAAANPKLKAAVVCYGPLHDTLLLRSIKAPVLGVFGQNDGRVTNMVPTEQRILGARFVADSYIGTGHGFLKPGRKGSGTAEANRALTNIDNFFAKKLDHK